MASPPLPKAATLQQSAPTARMTRHQVLLVALLVVASLLNYIDRQATGAVAPTLKEQFHLTNEAWGWMNTAFSVVYTFTTSAGGIFIDRVGVAKGLLLSVVVWSIASAGHALASGFGSLCFWRMMLAVGEGPGAASPLKGIRRAMPPRLWDTGAALIGAGAATGGLIAPFLVVPLTDRYGWRAAFLVTGAISLIWLVPWLLTAMGPAAGMGPNPPGAAPPATRPRATLDWRSRVLWGTGLCILLTVPPTVFVNNFLALYLNQSYGVPQADMTRWQWQPFLAVDLGQLVGGGLASYWISRGRSQFSTRAAIVLAGFLGSVVLVGANYASGVEGAVWAMNLSRFFFQAAYIVMVTHAIQAVPDEQTAYLNGLMNGAFSLCNVIMNPIIGRLSDQHGFQPVIWLVSLLPLLGMIAWLFFTGQHERSRTKRAA